jgi:exportin-1
VACQSGAMIPSDTQALLNFSEPWDAKKVQMLDHVVAAMLSSDSSIRTVAHEVLTQVRNHPDSWSAVDTILATSQSPDTKFIALQLLEHVIATRWLVLPENQRTGIKNYVVQLVIKISADEAFASQQKHFLTKLNETLIHIVKQDWPHSWENFIPDIVGSSKTSQSLCENNLRILNLLSEEVFSFGKGQMVSRKVTRLKASLNTQFSTIYELCDFIFKSHIQNPGSVKPPLLITTLSTLSNFLNWIPLGYIFETDLIQSLLVHFWDPLEYRIECVKCLNEIACLSSSEGAAAQPDGSEGISLTSRGVFRESLRRFSSFQRTPHRRVLNFRGLSASFGRSSTISWRFCSPGS